MGEYYDSSGGGGDFLYDGSKYTSVDGPLGTWLANAAGIDGDRIIGGYTDASSGTYVGFIATVPEPSTFVLAGLGLLSLLACARQRRRLQSDNLHA